MPWKVASLFCKVQLDDLVVPNKRKTSKTVQRYYNLNYFHAQVIYASSCHNTWVLCPLFIALSNKIHWKLCRRIFQQSCKIRFHITSIDLHVCVILFTRGVNYLPFSPRLWNNFFVLSTIDHHAMFSSNT